MRLPDNCTLTDSIRGTSCARHVKIAGQAGSFASLVGDWAALTHLP
jgi:hypothetical protein